MKVGILGAAGRMGRTLIEAVQAAEGLTLGAAVDVPSSSLIGVDAGELIGAGKLGVTLSDDLAKVVMDADVFIDFTLPEATERHVALCRDAGRKIIINTTGLSDAQKAVLHETDKTISICFAANYSVGVTLCLNLLKTTSRMLDDEVDIKIIKTHHRHKINAPSNTTL